MDRNQATIKAAIISIDDSIAMRVEKSIAYLEVVQTVIRLRSLDKSPNELADAGINCILLDLDTFDEDRVETYALSVNSIFSDTGTMMICLFSKSFDKIEEWDNRSIKSRQMRLFTAHIAMEDIPEKDVIQAKDNVTSVLFIKRAKDTLGRITNLVPSSEDGNLSAIQIDLSSAISDALQAIEIRDRPARPVPIIVPGMTVEKIESLI